MNEMRRKTVCLMSALVLSAGVLAGCAPSGCSSSSTAEKPAETAAAQKSVEATLYSFSGSEAVVQYDGTKYTLDLSNATIDSTALNVGNVLVITYEGELKADDASACKVASVTTKADAADSHELVGTLEDLTMNSITLRMIDGRKVTFNANNAEHSFAYGLDRGNWVTVVYTGELQGTDTSSLSVVRIHDMDTDYVKEVKAQTTIEDAKGTVYALSDVEVHSSYMMASDVVGTVKAQRALQLTGHCNNGWDRVTFDGKEAYVYSTYLTTKSNESASNGSSEVSQKVKLKEVNETVYATTDATIRAGYSTSAKAIGALKAGASIKRTGICDNGWSRVSYNGQVAFIYSNLLTTKNPNTETKGVKITAVNETVYVVAGEINVRKSWSKDSEALGSLKYGMKVNRTGICDNGWSRVVFNGADAYINSDLLSKTDPNATKTVTVYKTTGYAWAATDCDVRESYSADAKSLGTLTKGSGITITGVTDNNWSRVDFNGKEGYVNNDMLTSVNPNPDKPEDKKSDEVEEMNIPQDSNESNNTTEVEDPAEEQPADNQTDDQPADDQTDEEPADEQTEDQSDEQPADDQTEDQSDEQPADEQTADDQADEENSADQADDQSDANADEQEAPAEEAPVETHDIEGIVVGYSIDAITIQVANDGSNAASGDAAFDNAKGEVSTFYTIDISDAAQEYSKGVYEGLTVKVTYTGELSAMENVHATKITDSGVKQAEQALFRGTVVSTTENTVTVALSNGVNSTFNFEGVEVDEEKLVEGAQVKVTADMKGAKLEDNVFKASKIEFVD